MADLDRVSRLVQETMDRFDDPGMTVAALVRRCHRIAALRGDAVNLSWLSIEGTDLTVESKTLGNDTLADRLLREVPESERVRSRTKILAYMARRKHGEDGDIYGASIEQAESALQQINDELEIVSRVPPGMHPQDLGLRLLRMDGQRAPLVKARHPFEQLITVTRAALWEFLVATEWTLTFGEASAETFDRLRTYVDQQLTTIAAPALEQFQSAYRRLKEGGAEERAQAVTSCRRVLKTLADELFPARDEQYVGLDGQARDVKDDDVINRLAAFVTETVGSHQNGPAVQAAVEDVGTRVHALIELSSKGLHHEIGEYEVDTCVVQTYLIVADVLRMREQGAGLQTP